MENKQVDKKTHKASLKWKVKFHFRYDKVDFSLTLKKIDKNAQL